MPKGEAFLAGLVPTGKNVAWIVGIVATSVAGGFGLALGVGERAENIDSIPGLATQVEENREAIETISGDLDLLTCLASLSATGQVVDPLELPTICP